MGTCGKAATFQQQDPRSCSCRKDEEVEDRVDIGHWRQQQDGSDGRRNTEEKKTSDDDYEPVEKYWRAMDFVQWMR